MGRMLNSFKGQIGRDAGKVVSNVLFGDAHATPYRRAQSRGYKEAQNAHQIAQQQIVEQQITEQRQQQLYSLDQAVISNVDTIIGIPIPQDIEELVALMDELAIQLDVNKWKIGGAETKIRNKYPNAVLKKYEQCVRKLNSSVTDPQVKLHYNNELKKYKFKRTYTKYIVVWWLLGAFLFFIIFLSLAWIIDKA